MLWRFLDTGVHNASWNMAVDEALLLSCDEQPQITLRFYQWTRPTLSLGYFQRVADIDLEECERRGFEWIRRPTGGRAVLHDHELTYSVIAPIEILGESVSQSHATISRALARGLGNLGITAEFAQKRAGKALTTPGDDNASLSAACFAAPVLVELTVQSKKIIGSAQMRTKKSLLQHGSIPITLDYDALAALLRLPSAAIRQKAAGLADFLSPAPTINELKNALFQGFEEFFGIKLQTGELLAHERALIEKLCAQYSSHEWNWRR